MITDAIANGVVAAPPGAVPPGGAWRRRPATPDRLRVGALALILLVLLAASLAAPGFARPSNLANVVEQSATLALLGSGLTLVMIAGGADVVRGGIDLSLAANMGLCDAIFTASANAGLGDAGAASLALAAGGAVGLVNALAAVGFGVLPLLASLATMNICAGLELVITQNTVLTSSSPLLAFIAGTSAWGLSATDWILVGTASALLLVLHATPLGLRLRAVGGHQRAARAAGLNVAGMRAAAYVAAGLLAGLAAIIQAARLSGSSPGSGDLLLPVVLTSLLSVVFSRRLQPTVGGTLLAVLFIGCLANVFQLIDVSSDWVSGMEGLLILSVVAVRAVAGRSWRRPPAGLEPSR